MIYGSNIIMKTVTTNTHKKPGNLYFLKCDAN